MGTKNVVDSVLSKIKSKLSFLKMDTDLLKVTVIKQIIRPVAILFILSAIVLTPIGCNKDDGPTEPEVSVTDSTEVTEPEVDTTEVVEPEVVKNPTLTGISPTKGPKTSIVTINGSDFGTDGNVVNVFFNGLGAEVQSVSDTKIVAVVPPRSFTGAVTVEIDSTILTGPVFDYVITDVQVSTVAGSTQGFAEGNGANAQFDEPFGLAIDETGNIYVGEIGNHKIRKITPEGVVSTFAGSTQGFADGSGAVAQFSRPAGVTADSEGNIYVGDFDNHKIRKITPSGIVSTLAGSTVGFSDGTGTDARFNFPIEVAADSDGNIYVADRFNHRVRKITPSGVVITLAGSTKGFADGTGSNAQFSDPTGLATDAIGNVYVADRFNHRIRKITQNGTVSTLAGSVEGFDNGTVANAKFSEPSGTAVDAQGNIYVADRVNHKIRKISPGGEVITLAGSTQGFGEGTGANAKFNFPTGVIVDSEFNIYVADRDNHRIRKITQE